MGVIALVVIAVGSPAIGWGCGVVVVSPLPCPDSWGSLRGKRYLVGWVVSVRDVLFMIVHFSVNRCLVFVLVCLLSWLGCSGLVIGGVVLG